MSRRKKKKKMNKHLGNIARNKTSDDRSSLRFGDNEKSFLEIDSKIKLDQGPSKRAKGDCF